MNEVPIAIVVSPRDWAERLHRFLADHGGARVRARVLDAREALADGHEILVAEDITSFLTPRLVREIHGLGRRIVGIYDPSEPHGEERLRALGVDATAPCDAEPTEIVRVIVRLAGDVQGAGGLSTVSSGPEEVHIVEGSSTPRRGSVVAVAGPGGGAGVTEVAIHVAARLERRGDGSVLVDADLVAPSIAQRLGLALHPNLRTALETTEHHAGRIADCHLRTGSGLPVVVGLPSTARWHELRSVEVVGTVRALAEHHGKVVVDAGTAIDELATAHGPQRHGVARALIEDADVVVAVCAATPIGVGRLLRWMAEARKFAPETPVLVAVNRTPAGRFRRAEIEEEICRTLDVPSIGFLPSDVRVERAAWEGEVAPERSGFGRAIDLLTGAILDAERFHEVAA